MKYKKLYCLTLVVLSLFIIANNQLVNADSNTYYPPSGINPPSSLYSGYWTETGELITYRIVTPIIRTGWNQDTIGAIIFPNINGIDKYDLINQATLSLYFDAELDSSSKELMISVWFHAYPVENGVTLDDYEYNSLLLSGKATNVNLINITSSQWIEINVKNQVQELVNNYHWESDKGLCILIYSAAQDTARSYQSNIGLNIPKLYIEYETRLTGNKQSEEYLDQYRGVEIWKDTQGLIETQFIVQENETASKMYVLNGYYPTINRTLAMPRYVLGSVLEIEDNYWYMAQQLDGIGLDLCSMNINGQVSNYGELYPNDVMYQEHNNRLLFNETTNTFHCFFKRESSRIFYYVNATLINNTLSVGTVQEIEQPTITYDGVGNWIDVQMSKGYIYGITDCGHSSSSHQIMMFWASAANGYNFARYFISNYYLTTTISRCYVRILDEIDQIYFFHRMADQSGSTEERLWISNLNFTIGTPINSFSSAYNLTQWNQITTGSRVGAPAIYMREYNGTVSLYHASYGGTENLGIGAFYDYKLGNKYSEEDYYVSPLNFGAYGSLNTLDLYRIGNQTKLLMCDDADIYYNLPWNDSSIDAFDGNYGTGEIDTLESNLVDVIPDIQGTSQYYIIINGTRIDVDPINLDDIYDLIDDILGSDPVDPSGWEDTPYFTRNKVKLYFLIIGFALIFGPWFYYALVLKGFDKYAYLMIILFLNVIGLAVLWSIPVL